MIWNEHGLELRINNNIGNSANKSNAKILVFLFTHTLALFTFHLFLPNVLLKKEKNEMKEKRKKTKKKKREG